ncbi:acyloxyacyl hydrolase [Ectothiorhodospiraceae bacterium WFHF3C12]|nr:acyloxyacyl hydrolase [Ectothiorhodospiraceae bacterium WFHF3C12]
MSTSNTLWTRLGSAVALLLAAGAAMAADGPPGLTGLALGWFDQDAVGINLLWLDQGSDAGAGETWSVRLEHRFGGDLAWQPWPWLTARPWLSAEVTGHWGVWAGGGGVVDLRADHLVASVSLGAGLYSRGHGKDLGYPLEFRSGLEAGWVFDNGWRVTGGYYHLSNSEIRPDHNPGENSLLLYLHVPGLLER